MCALGGKTYPAAMKPRLSQEPHPHFAFTIVEALVAVIAIGILVALLLPAFTGTRECGPRSKAGSVVRSIVNSVKSFETDYDIPPLAVRPRNEREQFIYVGDPKSGALHSNAGLFDVLRAIPRGVNANHALNPRQ